MRSRHLSLILHSLIFASCGPHAASAAATAEPDISYSACETALNHVHFDANATRLAETCESRLRHLSLYLCIRTHQTGDAWIDGLNTQNETCQKWLGVSLPPFDIIANYTDDDVAWLRKLSYEDRVNKISLNEVVAVSDRLYTIAHDTLNAWAYVRSHHINYGWAMGVFWVVVILMGIASRLMAKLGTSQLSSKKSIAGSQRLAVWSKRYLTVPATFGYRCAQNLGWCTIPPRIQSLTILAFIIINVVFTVHGYIFFEENLYFEGITRQFLRYVSDRTGIISFANFPMIWLFGMRNNLALWLTGWDFGTYNNFHRWVARVATLQAVIHSLGYTILIIKNGGWNYFLGYWQQFFFWTGELATIFMCFIVVFSVYWLRRKQYELFLILHVILSILLLATMLGHISIFLPFGERWDLLVWVPAFIWVADRVARVSRTLSFNSRFWDTKASVTYDSKSNIIRLTVPHSSSLYTPQPGSYYYLHVLSDPKFWESHPFTMAYTTAQHRRFSKDHGEDTPLMQQDDDISIDANVEDKKPKMTFLIRPYDSFTGRLKEAASTSSAVPSSLRVFVEGPYGHTQPFSEFEHLVFVVGGSGIVVPLGYLRSLIASSNVQSIRIVWAVREKGFAEEVMMRDLGPFVGSEKLSLQICMTQGTIGEAPSGLQEEVELKYGRPDVYGEVTRAMRNASDSEHVAIIACGPARMADDARKSVVEKLKPGGPQVEYFEESFQW